jgi:ubiquinone biosynthesis protein UbiJ
MRVEALALPVINHLLSRADWAQAKLNPFVGRRARLLMSPWEIEFAIGSFGLLARSPVGDGAGTPVDVEIALPADAWSLALRGPTELMRAARVTGSADFSEALGFVLTRLRWDAEEDLAQLIGDIPAHRVGAAVKGLVGWQTQAAQRLAENLSEYLTEERPVLARAGDGEQLIGEVQRLRDDVARLEKRVQRLA